MTEQVLSTHPAAVAARERAQLRQAELAELRLSKQETLDYITDDFQLQFIDITPSPRRLTSGMTIAFTGNKVLCVSTAVRNPRDAYSKLEGRLAAAEAFDDGHWVYLRKPSGIKAAPFLRHVFSF